jgi:CheY-like chemotaxis protein/HPt (histidine-containing phosphotransfer) domain-containing protein
VVDDNEINRFVASEQIEGAGFNVDVATNGQEAVDLVKVNDYAAVLMDCQMPVMDGYTAARTIREWEADQDRHVPIIALTAHAMAGERDKVLAAGMDDYLSKPLRAQALERMVERYVRDAAPASGERDSQRPAQAVELDMSIQRSARLVQLFISKVPDNLSELDRAVAAADAGVIRERAHKLKGSCLAVGALAMAEEAQALQFEAERGELDGANTRASTLWAQFDRVSSLLSQESEPSPRRGPSLPVGA